MSYVDFSAAEATRMFSPPNGNAPQALPDLWRSAPGEEVRTDLSELTDEELNALGWKGPIKKPSGTSDFTHSYQWNSQTREYDAIEISEFEKRGRVNYRRFWNVLIDSKAYSSIKEAASQSLRVNTLATEFIALISDAKNGDINVEKIQRSLNEILLNISFTDSELTEIQTAFTESGMFAVYTLE